MNTDQHGDIDLQGRTLIKFSRSKVLATFLGAVALVAVIMIWEKDPATGIGGLKPEDVGANPNTFISLSDNFGKDSEHVYTNYLETTTKGYPIKDSNPIVVEADPNTFEVFNKTSYAKDANHVFSGREIVEGADPTTFSAYWNYGKDNQNVYINAKRIPGADAATFSVLNHDTYAKDARYVYYLCRIVPEADPQTFEDLYGTYAKDKNSGYYGNFPIPGSDSNSFKEIGYIIKSAKDKNHSYTFDIDGSFSVDGVRLATYDVFRNSRGSDECGTDSLSSQ